MPEVVIVGAGAAGLAAARRILEAGVDAVVLEAKDRVGGRAHVLTGRSGGGIDLGCGWMHSGDRNPIAPLAEALGFPIDRSVAPWMRPALEVNFPLAEQAAYRQAFDGFEARVRRAADGPEDFAAADLFNPADAPWQGLLDAFSGFYNGAPFERISVKDYAAYEATEENWRTRAGYGAVIAGLAAGLDIRLNCPVRRIEQRPGGVKVVSNQGDLETQAVIVCVPAAILAREAIVFDPPLPDRLEAAAALPLGHVEKAFLKVRTPEVLPLDIHAFGRTDVAETGSYTLRPMGLPVVECFFGGDLAATLESQDEGALAAFAATELTSLFGSDIGRRLEPLARSAWRADPFIGGAYSHARVGHADARARLASSAGDRLLFAGEACSPHAFSTAHGAYETGRRAAANALHVLG